ncbi:hypothetical protein K8I85_01210 [bacterium]|nr:hypothetical protein [bacterium]
MRVSGWTVPALVAIAATIGVGASRLVAAPSLVRDYAAAPSPGEVRTATFVVSGVRCVDTAEAAARQIDGEPGVVRLTAWASRARLEVAFDPAATGVQAIRDAIEAPVFDTGTGEITFGVYEVREIDGVKVQ